MSSDVNRRAGFGPFAKLAIVNAAVQGGGLGPLGKIAVAKNLMEKFAGGSDDDKVQQTAAPVIQNSQGSSSQSGGIRGRGAQAKEKLQEIGEQKEAGKTKIEQLQSAAKVSQNAGLVITAVGAVSYFYDSVWALPELGFGIVLLCAGVEGNTILANMKAIMDKPLDYKELPSGKWKVEEIGKQLKKDLYISGWVVDNFIIPSKFSN